MTDYLYSASDIPLRTGVIDGRKEDQHRNDFPDASLSSHSAVYKNL